MTYHLDQKPLGISMDTWVDTSRLLIDNMRVIATVLKTKCLIRLIYFIHCTY